MSASSSITGIPAPVTATQAGAVDPSGNLQPLEVDVDGNLLVNVNGGTVIATNPSVAPTGDPVPTDATFVAGTDGTNLQGLKTDANGELQVDVLSSALPSGAATEATLATLNGKVTVCNTGAIAGTVAVSNFPATQPVSGSVTVVQPTGTNLHTVIDSGTITTVSTVTAVTAITNALPAGTNNIGGVDVLSLPAIPTGSNVIGAVNQNGTWTVQPGNTPNTTPWLVKESVSATATLSNVSSSASNVTVLASNASRLGATVFNDSTATLYLKFGATASTSSYTVQIPTLGYYELPTPHLYTGIIDGIWSAANGNARVTELT